MEMMDLQVFIALALGVPQHRDFDALHLVNCPPA
jgi:hypothetical protein